MPLAIRTVSVNAQSIVRTRYLVEWQCTRASRGHRQGFLWLVSPSLFEKSGNRPMTFVLSDNAAFGTGGIGLMPR